MRIAVMLLALASCRDRAAPRGTAPVRRCAECHLERPEPHFGGTDCRPCHADGREGVRLKDEAWGTKCERPHD